MIKSTHLLFPLCMGAMLSVGACATTPKAEQAAATPENATVVESTKQATTKTDSKKLICKPRKRSMRKSKRTFCATAKQWKSITEQTRQSLNTPNHNPGTAY